MAALTIHPKVAGGAIGGSIALIVLYGLSYALVVPPEVAAAVGVISTSICAYLSPWFAENQPGVDPSA